MRRFYPCSRKINKENIASKCKYVKIAILVRNKRQMSATQGSLASRISDQAVIHTTLGDIHCTLFQYFAYFFINFFGDCT